MRRGGTPTVAYQVQYLEAMRVGHRGRQLCGTLRKRKHPQHAVQEWRVLVRDTHRIADCRAYQAKLTTGMNIIRPIRSLHLR